MKRAAIGQHRLMNGRFCRKNGKLVGRAYHRTFDEQTIDTAWIFNRVDQAAARFQIERQRARAEVQVKVEQGGRAL